MLSRDARLERQNFGPYLVFRLFHFSFRGGKEQEVKRYVINDQLGKADDERSSRDRDCLSFSLPRAKSMRVGISAVCLDSETTSMQIIIRIVHVFFFLLTTRVTEHGHESNAQCLSCFTEISSHRAKTRLESARDDRPAISYFTSPLLFLVSFARIDDFSTSQLIHVSRA